MGAEASRHSRRWRTALVLFNCARCRCQMEICSHCDRGHIYCGPGCARAARFESFLAANRRYQDSFHGFLRHDDDVIVLPPARAVKGKVLGIV